MIPFRHFSENADPNGKPMPKREYFSSTFSIGGQIIEIYAVHGVMVRDHRNLRWDSVRKKYVLKPGTEVWRWRVRIRTDEGWILMGHIGKAQAREDLPPVRLGDRVELEKLSLSSHTGGSYAQVSRWRSEFRPEGVDWRPKNLARQLFGKVKRK